MKVLEKPKLLIDDLYLALDEKRNAENLSWRGLAKLCGVDPSLFSRMGKGDGTLEPENLRLFTSWLERSTDEFFDNYESHLSDRERALRAMSRQKLLPSSADVVLPGDE